MIELAVGIQVGNIMEIETQILHRLARGERALDVGTRLQIAGLDADVGIAAASLVMTVVNHFVQIAVQFKGNTFAKFIYVNHGFFPYLLKLQTGRIIAQGQQGWQGQ
jgi:hypothetical protein